MIGYHEEGLRLPFSYAREELKPYAPSLSGDELLTTASFVAGSGSWPVGLLPEDAHDFWANIKTMYYNITAAVEIVSTEEDPFGYSSFAVSSMASLSTAGVTRRFWNFPNRSPGWHRTFKRGTTGLSPNAVEAVSIDFGQAVYAWKSRAPKGTYWFPKLEVEASLDGGGANLHITTGGTDGYLSFESLPGAVGTMPAIPSVGLSLAVNGAGQQVGSPALFGTMKALERYDMIDFYPKLGPAGTNVTIVQPACSPNWEHVDWREGFKHVKEVWIGDKKITTFNPNTHITGQQKEFITVTIPAGAKTGPFRFMAKYDNQPGFDDYYHTWQDFSVR